MRSVTIVIMIFVLLGFPSFALAHVVELENGDRLNGTIVERTDDVVVMEHPVLGRLEIPQDKIRRKEEAEEGGLFGTKFLRGWDSTVGLGLSGSEGTTEDVDLNVTFNTRYADARKRWDIRAAYFISGEDGNRSKNEGWLDVDRDWLFSESKWFFFADGRYDYDEFQAFDHRLAAHVGPGYDLFTDETWDIIGRLGVGVNHTFGGEERTNPEGLVGLNLTWRLTENQTIESRNRVFPNLEDTEEVRTINSLDWIINISRGGPISLKFGAEFQYDSETEGEETDLTYYGNLNYSF